MNPSALRFCVMPDGQTRETHDVPDAKLYRPLFSPWFGGGDKAFRAVYEPIRPYSLVSSDRSWVLYSLARQALRLGSEHGEFWECGVYKGCTAMLLAALIERDAVSRPPHLRSFDTFQGIA